MKKLFFIASLTFMALITARAQDGLYAGNPDASFFAARDLAFAGNHVIARDTLHQILTRYPDYSDVRSLLAKTYSWDGNYDEARKHFNRITSADRENKEAWLAAIKNEIYAENSYIALGLANKALIYLPEDAELLSIQEELAEKLNKETDSGSSERAVDSLEAGSYTNQVAIYNAFDVFDIVYDPMIYSGVEYTRDTDAGKIIPRVNYANRFETHGLQFEMDFYPELSKTFYGYLNYGYSASDIFPNHRVGVELYANLPKGKEASLGIRYLDFLNSKNTLYTASFGLYKGNYYWSLRTYVTPNAFGSTGLSGTLTGRKYLSHADQYLGLLLAIGYTPELKQLTSNNVLLSETLLFVESQQLLFEYQFTNRSRTNLYRAQLGLTHQELVFEADSYFWAITAGLRYHVRF